MYVPVLGFAAALSFSASKMNAYQVCSVSSLSDAKEQLALAVAFDVQYVFVELEHPVMFAEFVLHTLALNTLGQCT